MIYLGNKPHFLRAYRCIKPKRDARRIREKLVNHDLEAFRVPHCAEENVVRCPYKTTSSSTWQFHKKLLPPLYIHQTMRDSQWYKNEFTGTKTIGFLPIRSSVICELFRNRRPFQLSNLYNSKFSGICQDVQQSSRNKPLSTLVPCNSKLGGNYIPKNTTPGVIWQPVKAPIIMTYKFSFVFQQPFLLEATRSKFNIRKALGRAKLMIWTLEQFVIIHPTLNIYHTLLKHKRRRLISSSASDAFLPSNMASSSATLAFSANNSPISSDLILFTRKKSSTRQEILFFLLIFRVVGLLL